MEFSLSAAIRLKVLLLKTICSVGSNRFQIGKHMWNISGVTRQLGEKKIVKTCMKFVKLRLCAVSAAILCCRDYVNLKLLIRSKSLKSDHVYMLTNDMYFKVLPSRFRITHEFGYKQCHKFTHFFFVNLSLLQRNKIGLHLRLSETKEDIPPMLPRSEKQEQIRSYWAVCLGRFNYSLLVVIT